MDKPGSIHARIRVDFTAGPSIGPGKIALLERIDACRSLSQAARELGLSYRRGWLLLDDLNHAFEQPVVVTAVGGVHGGGAQLTEFGHALIACYRRAADAAEAAAQREFRGLPARIEEAGRRAARRRSPGTRGGAATAGGSLRRSLQRSLKGG